MVSGEYIVQRIGYDEQPLGLVAVLPPLAITLVMASVCTGIRFLHGFEPTNSVSLITASAAGGVCSFPTSRARRLIKRSYR
jgi:hypothetical protein